MQDSWLRKKADEIQHFADRIFFDALKTVYGPQSSGTTPLLSADGTSLLTDKEAILKRWAEDGLNTLMVSLISHHLSIMKLSTDYHRWNVIRCLMSSLNRLNEHLERSGPLPESQCGFRKNRGTIDMIFTARELQEKCQEQNVDHYMTFVDLTKAFDTVSREGLWKIMAKVWLSCQIHSNGAAVS